MEFRFFSPSGGVLFTRSDIEQGHWTQEEMNVTATFPFNKNKEIERGQRIAFNDPATGDLQVFEIRKVQNVEPDHYQQLTAESVVISELSDEHIDSQEITDKTPTQALTTVLSGTEWNVGNVSVSNTSSCDIGRGSVWQAVNAIQTNWNVYITPRYTVNADGTLSGRYLDVRSASAVVVGVRLSIDKNMSDSSVSYDDTEVLTALYGYGGSVDVPQENGDDIQETLNFSSIVWSATSSHPAKPSGQTYLEWPEKTAIYGRNGRARFGYYQNGDIKDASVLLSKTWEALQATCEPKINISGTVSDLYRLGYADEPLKLNDTVIVEIRQTGEKFHKKIIRLDVDLLDPTGNTVEIGDYVPNIIYINRQTEEEASGGGGGGGGGRGDTNEDYEDSEFETRIEKNATQIGLVVGRNHGEDFIRAGEIALSINETTGEATAWINADHVNISATQDAHMLAGSLYYDSEGRLVIENAGGVYVERTESGQTAYFGVWDQGNLTGGVMITEINGETTLTISADRIDIDGIVTALRAIDVTVNALTVINGGGIECGAIDCTGIDCTSLNTNDGTITCGDINAGAIVGTSLQVGSYGATWKSATIRNITTGTYRYFLYGTSTSSTTATGAAGMYPVTGYNDVTIYYLGR